MSAVNTSLLSKTSVVVMLAVNDPANGNFVGKCEAVEIPDVITVEERGTPLAVEFLPDQARIAVVSGVLEVGVSRYRYWHYKRWVGNWCWDQVRMTLENAARLLEQLRDAGWGYDVADTRVADAWTKGEPLAPVLARVAEEMMRK